MAPVVFIIGVGSAGLNNGDVEHRHIALLL
jgi:hypothetical protein